jgi:hypothetical protein
VFSEQGYKIMVFTIVENSYTDKRTVRSYIPKITADDFEGSIPSLPKRLTYNIIGNYKFFRFSSLFFFRSVSRIVNKKREVQNGTQTLPQLKKPTTKNNRYIYYVQFQDKPVNRMASLSTGQTSKAASETCVAVC